MRRAFSSAAIGACTPPWYTPAGTETTAADWNDPTARCVALYLDGADDPDRTADGTPLADDDYLLLINAWWEPLDFHVLQTRPDQAWHPELDPYEPADVTETAKLVGGDPVPVGPRSIRVLRGTSDRTS
jgi:isoamylase